MPRPYNTRDKFNPDLSKDQVIENLGYELRVLRNEVKKLQSERDYYKNRVRELEIPKDPLPRGV